MKDPERSKDSEDEECQDCIFGYEFFKYSPSTFIQTSLPVPSDYVLGPGDKLKQIFWIQCTDSRILIARNGEIFLPLISLVSLAGLKFEEARNF